MGTLSVAPVPDKLASALRLAGRGFRVFPCKPDGKSPSFDGWQEAATTDPDLIGAWWSGIYREHNIGVATGRGLLVLDFDTKNGKQGLKSLEELERRFNLPWGYRVQTPSGGIHVYLAIPEDVAGSVDAYTDYPGMDVRCEGNLVVGPGSTINGVSYVELGP